jgi:hypothetical protein
VKRTVPIDVALADGKLLGSTFGDTSTWRTWSAVLKAAFGRPLSAQERTAFAAVSGGRAPPARQVAELWCVAGRRSGKSRIAATVATYLATCIDHRARLSAGEVGTVLVLAPSKAQAAIVLGYVKAMILGSPLLRREVVGETADEIRLRDGIVIAVHAANYKSVRGRTLLACVADESSFWKDESSTQPDLEIYRAVLPALASTDGMLIGISSPYRRIGLLFTKFRDCFGQDGDDVLIVKGATSVFNPLIDQSVIARARAADPTAALSEWDAEFRSDLASFLDDESIDAAIDRDRPLELPPRKDVRYRCFVDMSGGRHDASCIAVVHAEGNRDARRLVLDVVRGRKGDPAAATKEFANLARQYFTREVTGDAYGADWVAGAFATAGCRYVRSELVRSELYVEGLPHFTRGLVSIPDHPALLRELRLLERRTSRAGRDVVDHGVGGSDDHANSLFGAMWLVAGAPQPLALNITPQILERASRLRRWQPHDGLTPWQMRRGF